MVPRILFLAVNFFNAVSDRKVTTAFTHGGIINHGEL
jgi:hypothetical protein